MLAPTLGVQRRIRGEHRTGAVTDQGKCGRGIAELRGEDLEFLEHRIEQLRVESVRGLQPGASRPVLAAGRHDLVQILAGAREHGVATVVGADGNTRELLRGPHHVFRIGEHRHHPAAGRKAAEQSAAFGDQPRAVLEGEHSRHAGGRVLAHAVSEHHVGFDAPGLPEPGQAHLDGEDRRLGERGVPQRFRGFAIGGQQDVQKRTRQRRIDGLGAAPDGFGEYRLGVEQFACHTRVLAALTGEEPGRGRRVGALSADQAGSLLAGHQIAEQQPGFPSGVRDQRRAVLEVGTSCPGGEAHVGDRSLRVGLEPG